MANNRLLTCFKTYDIRGKLGDELNTEIAYKIARAFAQYLQPKKVVVGSDVRISSPELKQAVTNGLLASGIDVIDIGTTGSEEVYFATNNLNADGGIEITASHNPIDYNGMKLVVENAKPISTKNLLAIKQLAEHNQFKAIHNRGTYKQQSNLSAYIDHLLTYINISKKPMKLVVNAGNGAAGHVIDAIEQQFINKNIPIEFIKINHKPDGNFPNGIPNPLLSENRTDTSNAVIKHQADMGIAWDGDFDRCFFFDETDTFIDSYYIVGLLAKYFLQQQPKAKIIHDPRLVWNTLDIISKYNGKPIMAKTGHVFIKEKMRNENAIYAGEMSGHHYFRDFNYCDSGMIPWLIILRLLCETGKKLSAIINDRISLYLVSGEINFKLQQPQRVIKKILTIYQDIANSINNTDGISLEFTNWRFNLRASNTEPLIRLNIETRNNKAMLVEKTRELVDILNNS